MEVTVRRNPARRAALLDAAIEVLAREGSRGLTLRAIDAEGGVPTGTATNYFANRADLLTQVMHRTRERLTPDPEALAETMRQAPAHALVTELMRQLLGRMRADRSGYLAMLELRLEATRRPELHTELGGFLTAEHEGVVRFHLDAGLPGDATGVGLLYFAMTGLLLDDFTAPAITESYDTEALIEKMVNRLLPEKG